jgi:hypothetical protein
MNSKRHQLFFDHITNLQEDHFPSLPHHIFEIRMVRCRSENWREVAGCLHKYLSAVTLHVEDCDAPDELIWGIVQLSQLRELTLGTIYIDEVGNCFTDIGFGRLSNLKYLECLSVKKNRRGTSKGLSALRDKLPNLKKLNTDYPGLVENSEVADGTSRSSDSSKRETINT